MFWKEKLNVTSYRCKKKKRHSSQHCESPLSSNLLTLTDIQHLSVSSPGFTNQIPFIYQVNIPNKRAYSVIIQIRYQLNYYESHGLNLKCSFNLCISQWETVQQLSCYSFCMIICSQNDCVLLRHTPALEPYCITTIWCQDFTFASKNPGPQMVSIKSFRAKIGLMLQLPAGPLVLFARPLARPSFSAGQQG